MALKLSTQALKLLSHVFLNAQLSISGANTAPVLFNQLHIVILISDYVMKTTQVKRLYKVLKGFIPLLSGKPVQWVGFRNFPIVLILQMIQKHP